LYLCTLTKQMMGNLVYIITGEPSGDILASRLMQALRKQRPGVQFAGVGGETMKAAGFQTLFDIAETSVMGFWEVLPRLPLILKRIKQVVADIERLQPAVIVTVDSWGLVASVVAKLKKKKITIPRVHYVAPQVWAWKKGRAKKCPRMFDRLMTLWPYEPKYFEKHGLRCDFVGHPVIENTAGLNDDLAAFKAQHGIPQEGTLLCVLPGSRQHEVKKLAPIFLQVAERLAADFPDLFVVVPSVAAIADEVSKAFAGMAVPHTVVVGQRERYNVFRASRFAIAASGTVTLELTACGTPHVIAYTFNWATNVLIKSLKRFADIRFANLVNILAGRIIIPELVLNDCRADKIYAAVRNLLQHPAQLQAQIADAKESFAHLKPEGMLPSEKAAAVVAEYLI